MRFYLGTHKTGWLGTVGVPLCVSRRALAVRHRLPAAVAPWVLDSGGFTELAAYGEWRTEPARYADEAARYAAEIGRLEWAAVQDWMCEPAMIAITGKSVAEHQERTTASYLELKTLTPSVPWLPIVQGYTIDQYLAHVAQYQSAGITLAGLPIVGVGSVCRRQSTGEIVELFAALAGLGIRCHGFGVKTAGLKVCSLFLESSDSLAWSLRAKKRPPLPGCVHRTCANCARYALRWRARVLEVITRKCQARLW